MTDEPTLYTTRETVAVMINELPALRALGLVENAVYQADTMSTPQERPFIVIRWLDEVPGLGRSRVLPFDVWGYDREGDYTRIDRILWTIADYLCDQIAVPTDGGVISQILGRSRTNNPGLGRGSDLYDDGYKCIVVPWHFRAIATGV